MNKSIIEKIQKLLSLATSSNEHESRLAASKAQELLVIHNLELQQIKNHIPDYDCEVVMEQKYEPKDQIFISNILEKFFFIKSIKSYQGNSFKLQMIGTKENLEIAKFVRSFLISKFRSLWSDFKKQYKLNESSRNSYYLGLFKGLSDQLEQSRLSAQEKMGLVLINDPRLDEAMKLKFPHLTTGKSRSIQGDGFSEKNGFDHGKNIRISKGISSNSGNKGILLK